MFIFFDDMVDGLREAGRYLYFTPVCYYPLLNIRPGDFVEDEGETDLKLKVKRMNETESDDETDSSEGGFNENDI